MSQIIFDGQQLTGYQLMKQVSTQYPSAKFRYDREIVVTVQAQGPVLMVGTLVAQVKVTRSYETVTQTGTRCLMIDTENGQITFDHTVWARPEKETSISTWGVRNTPERVNSDRLAWMLCHRPGTGSRFGQLDSYGRACQGYDYSQRNFTHARTKQTRP